MKDKKILKKIADFAQIEKTDVVVEVGAGEGTLTTLLLERAKKVIAIEKDEKLAEQLKRNFKSQILNDKLEIVSKNILDIEIKDIFTQQTQKCTDIFLLENSSCSPRSGSQGISEPAAPKYLLVGNIPYYITGALFKKFLESQNQPKSMTFVVQKEVADRILARDKKESILSISIKVYGEPEYGGIIKAGSFYPKPKVDSAIIAIRSVSKEKFLRSDLKFQGPKGQTFEEDFFKILKAGFAHKRKLLIKNLMSKGVFEMPRSQKTPFDIFKKCGIPEKARAEDLSVENWTCLTKNLL